MFDVEWVLDGGPRRGRNSKKKKEKEKKRRPTGFLQAQRLAQRKKREREKERKKRWRGRKREKTSSAVLTFVECRRWCSCVDDDDVDDDDGGGVALIGRGLASFHRRVATRRCRPLTGRRQRHLAFLFPFLFSLFRSVLLPSFPSVTGFSIGPTLGSLLSAFTGFFFVTGFFSLVLSTFTLDSILDFVRLEGTTEGQGLFWARSASISGHRRRGRK